MEEPPERRQTQSLTLEPGDFAWAPGKAQLWWPARVCSDANVPSKADGDRPDGSHSVYLTCFSDGPSGWYDLDNLIPFEQGFAQFAAQSASPELSSAVFAAVDAFARCVEDELTCGCAKGEAAGGNPSGRSRRIAEAVASAVPEEVLKSVRELAVDAGSKTDLESGIVREWVVAFTRRTLGQCVQLAEFTVVKGLPAAREKVGDLNACDGSFSDGVDPWEERGKKRSMAELIAGLDMGDVGVNSAGDGKGDFGEERKQKDEKAKEANLRNVEEVAAEEVFGSGRRERKKSKYLSPPYTLVNLKGRKGFRTKSSENRASREDALDANAEEEMTGKLSRSRSAARQRVVVYQDESEFILDENTQPVNELVMQLQFVALDAMHLVGSQSDHSVRGFFGKFRRSVYRGSTEVETDTGSQLDRDGAVLKTMEAVSLSSPRGGETPAVVEGRSANGKKMKTPAATDSDAGAKRRSKTKKKSIGGITGNFVQETGSIQEVNGSGGEDSAVKRKRRKKNVADDGKGGARTETPQLADAGQETNGTKGGESAKKKNKKKKDDEQTNTETGVPMTENTAVEANGSEEGKSVKKVTGKKKQEATVDVVPVPTVDAIQEANGCTEGKLENEISREMKEDSTMERGGVSVVPVNLEASGKEQANSEVGCTPIEVEGTAMAPVTLEAGGPGDGKPTKRAYRKKKALNIDIGASHSVAGGEDNGESKPKQKRQRKKKEETGALQSVAGSEANVESKPKKKRQRKKKEETSADIPSAAAAPAQEVTGEIKPKQKRNRKKKEEASADKGATLLLSFSQGAELPSKEDLISTYSKFGMLSEPKVMLMKETSSASVVFEKKSEAEKAFNSVDRDRALGVGSIAACKLQCAQANSSIPTSPTQISKPSLEDVKKNLESMISTLAASGMNVRDFLGSDGGLNMNLKENLVDEMSGLLKKVNSFLGGGPSSASGGGASTGGAAT